MPLKEMAFKGGIKVDIYAKTMWLAECSNAFSCQVSSTGWGVPGG